MTSRYLSLLSYLPKVAAISNPTDTHLNSESLTLYSRGIELDNGSYRAFFAQ